MECTRPLNLDPWSASSLLQKAIRRGEVEQAIHAVHTLHRQRGKAVWRRLIGIAFEDVGIADPALVSELAFIATDGEARSLIGSDIDLIVDFTRKLAEAPKDRSSDYLFTAAIKHPLGLRDRSHLTGLSSDKLVSIAADSDQFLLRRSVATLIACTREGAMAKATDGSALAKLIAELQGYCPSPLLDATRAVSRVGVDAIVLMVPLLWSTFIRDEAVPRLVPQPIRPSLSIGGVPLYAFDMFTSSGKQAISIFAQENEELRHVLLDHAPDASNRDVAAVAVFYAEGAHVTPRFLWDESHRLERLGIEADMIGAGCAKRGIEPIIDCVSRNLGHLNDVRLRILSKRVGK